MDSVKLFGEKIGVRARILQLEGVSGHADKNGLTDWLRGFKEKPKRVFIVHGEDTVTDEYAGYLRDEFGYEERRFTKILKRPQQGLRRSLCTTGAEPMPTLRSCSIRSTIFAMSGTDDIKTIINKGCAGTDRYSL